MAVPIPNLTLASTDQLSGQIRAQVGTGVKTFNLGGGAGSTGVPTWAVVAGAVVLVLILKKKG